MQAVVRARSGMVCEQTRKASFMQRPCSSELWANAEADSRTENAAASAIFCMACPLQVRGPESQAARQEPSYPFTRLDGAGHEKVQSVARKSRERAGRGRNSVFSYSKRRARDFRISYCSDRKSVV